MLMNWSARASLTYIHGFDNPAIIAGQGTLGLEILDQVPDVEAIVLPIGGGGLAAGVSVAVKSLRPEVQIFGVEPDQMPTFTAALAAGHPVDIPLRPTLADGLAVGRIGERSFALAAPLLDRVVTVSEEQFSLAILRLAELEKSVVEGAGGRAAGSLPGWPIAGIGRPSRGAGADRGQYRPGRAGPCDRAWPGRRRPALPIHGHDQRSPRRIGPIGRANRSGRSERQGNHARTGLLRARCFGGQCSLHG